MNINSPGVHGRNLSSKIVPFGSNNNYVNDTSLQHPSNYKGKSSNIP